VSDAGDVVVVERHGHVALLTLNRPGAMNAINSVLAEALGAALEAAELDDDVRVIVITGAGRAFCAGADLKAVAAGEPLLWEDRPDWGVAGYVRHWVTKPTIAAVHGYALGGGMELVLATDLAVAEEAAVLGLPEVRRGLVAGAGGLLRLPQQVPRKVALEWVLAGETFSARDAARWGLVNRVVTDGSAMEAALRLAEVIASNAPVAVRASKALVHRARHLDDWSDEAWAENDAVFDAVLASHDATEGARAFADKRLPVWTGR
jgi:enoyl-CoA hydratase/carnithine racemase